MSESAVVARVAVSLRGPRPPRLLVTLGIAAAAVASIPLLYLLVRVAGSSADEIVTILGRPRVPLLVGNTVLLAIAVTASCVVIGVPTAYLLVRARLWGRRLWAVLAALPLAVPSYLAAYGWLAAFPSMHGFAGSWLVLTLVTVRGGLSGSEPGRRFARRLSPGHSWSLCTRYRSLGRWHSCASRC